MVDREESLPTVEETADLERTGFDAAGYWRANIILILSLLAVWAIVSYGCSILLVDWLNHFSLGHLPLGFWFAQQGAIYVFVVLIFVYAWMMDRLDKKYQADELRRVQHEK